MKPTRIGLVVAAGMALFAGVAPISVTGEVCPPASQGAAPKGIESDDLDRSVDPCTDFYGFANGAWRAANPIPDGASRWSRRWAARDANRQQLKTLLEELAARADLPRGSVEQQLGDHFAACMDEPAIGAAGVTPLAPLLADIGRVRDAAGVQRMIRRLHELAIPAPFVLTGASDYNDPAGFVVNIAAGGLGLPDRDSYLKPEPRFADMRERYRAHVARVLTLAGMAAVPARKAADRILALETRLAEASLAPAAAADPATTAHKLTFAQLAQLAPRFDWESYFAEAGLPRIDVNVAEPAFVERLNRELTATPVAAWKAYLRWHLLESAAPWLSKPFAEESFAFKDKYLGGATAPKPRAMRCLESTEALLGEPLGRKYAERYFPPAAKAKVQEMVRTLVAVLKDDLRELKWMSDATRQEALAKFERYDVKVGYPDAWTDHSALIIRRDAFWANVAASRRFGVEADRKRIGQRASREIWLLPPSSPDAYLDVQLNLMALPAGFLQPPAFDLAASDAVNYGAIGISLAHDLTHAIDALGADFDSTGQPRKWWTEPDRDAFQKLGQCSVDQYDGYAIEPGVHLQGKQVLGEALADLAGVRVAYVALQRSMQSHPVPVIGGLSPGQQFFVAWGQLRGAAESPDLQRQMVKTDTHPTARYRIIGPLSNAPEFQKAFACKDGSAMVRPPEKRCAAW
ncbi:MAG: M13 family metallopeptidase [Acidobacteriota bacterium]|nr:M13 family metallopeptidase [Acidobacteriota bacterium]